MEKKNVENHRNICKNLMYMAKNQKKKMIENPEKLFVNG